MAIPVPTLSFSTVQRPPARGASEIEQAEWARSVHTNLRQLYYLMQNILGNQAINLVGTISSTVSTGGSLEFIARNGSNRPTANIIWPLATGPVLIRDKAGVPTLVRVDPVWDAGAGVWGIDMTDLGPA